MAISMRLPEEHRDRLTLGLAAIGWVGALAFTILSVTAPPERPVGTVVICFTGLAIAATLARSRMRMTQTITRVFEAGLSASVALQANMQTDVPCVVETNTAGLVLAAENTEFVGWPSGGLVGKQLVDLVGDERSRLEVKNRLNLFDGDGFDSRVISPSMALMFLDQDSCGRPMRMSIARLGDVLIATLTPVRSPYP